MRKIDVGLHVVFNLNFARSAVWLH